MELLLNIIATATILALVAIWRAHWVPQMRRRNRDAARECMAISCLAILAFFTISMTDDLRGDITVLEECSQNRYHSVAISGNHRHHQKIKIDPENTAILPFVIALTRQDLTTRIAPAVHSSTSFLLLRLLPSRAPPPSV